MPTLTSTDERITPKSIIRHRPIGEGLSSGGKRTMVTDATTPVVQRASRQRPTTVHDDVAPWKRIEEDADHPHTHSQPGVRRASIRHQPASVSRPGLLPQGGFTTLRAHPLLYLGIGMLMMLFLWTVLSAAFGWVGTTLDDLRYGRPRTFQMDAWVGHNEQTGIPSHFIAMNLNRRIEIIEFPGGDASHARVYLGPQLFGPSDDLVPVTLTFLDVNGDHKPDMLVTFQDSRIVFINDGTQFRPMTPGEKQGVDQFLQRTGK